MSLSQHASNWGRRWGVVLGLRHFVGGFGWLPGRNRAFEKGKHRPPRPTVVEEQLPVVRTITMLSLEYCRLPWLIHVVLSDYTTVGVEGGGKD